MSVTEVLRGPGSWGLQLNTDMPDKIWKKIEEFGHICIHVGKVNPVVSGDSLLGSSRYTGVLHGISDQPTARGIRGFGMSIWLGDADNKGYVRETPLTMVGETFQDAITALLPVPGPIIPGTIFNVGETWSGTFQFQTPLQEIDYVCQTLDCAWRVNGDGTLDAGTEADLFAVNPKVVVTRKSGGQFRETSASDMFLRSLNGSSATERDREDFTTRVLLLAQGADGSSATATADINPGLNPFKDIHGNFVKLTRIVQESDTDPANAAARAQLQLNRFSGSRNALTLSTANYDIKGDAQVGDYLWVSDPEMELVDVNNELIFRNKRLNPMKLRLTETTWPVVKGMSVLYRHYDGTWIDLTPYVSWESGETQVVVGGYNRLVSSGGGGVFPVTPPDVNLTIPGQTQWDLPFNQSVYQSPITGETRSDIELKWFQPDNTDLSNIIDGDHYEIRYRRATTPIGPTTHNMMSAFSHDELAVDGTFAQPIVFPAMDWQYAYAPWSSLKFRLQELVPSMPYEVQIRAIDDGTPPNIGEWSVLEEFQTSHDNIPPATPSGPTVASNLLSVQVVHRLGRSSGGDFNLDRDLHHLEVHGGSEPLFHPTDETLLGKMMAGWGMIVGNIPAVATFPIRGIPRPPNADPGLAFPTTTLPMFFKVIAVDEAGNKSLPSIAVESSAELIGSQYVSDLTASKITAGRLTAEIAVAGRIMTAEDGPRVQMSYSGIQGYKEDNTLGLDWQSKNGLLHVLGEAGIKVTGGGNVEITDGALVVKNDNGNVIVEVGECQDGRHGIQVFKDNGLRVARIGELESSGGDGIEFVDDLGRLVRANTMAFGIKSATITNVENGVSTAGFQNFSAGGIGPSVTVSIGNTLTAIVMISSIVNPLGSATGGAVSFNTFGPSGYFAGASELRSLWILGVDAPLMAATKAFNVVVPSVGDYTFTMVRWTTGPAGTETQYGDRHIIAIPY
jgi:hypothetical protein